ncbi:MAG: hypothetical protein AAGI46_14700 [Planctomycetota bacterium]
MPETYRAFIDREGHGFTEDGMFHFFGASDSISHDIEKWNDWSVWRHAFPAIKSEWMSFAQDVFGNQFFLRRDGKFDRVKMLALWTGTFTIAAGSFQEFIECIVVDPEVWMFAREKHRDLVQSGLGDREKEFDHLVHKIPLFLGGDLAASNFEWCDGAANMSIISQLRTAAL